MLFRGMLWLAWFLYLAGCLRLTPYPSFRAVELVDGEERLPFTVQMLGSRDNVTGYVRIADNAIFISRPETKDHIRSTLDPRFAPVTKIVALPEDPT